MSAGTRRGTARAARAGSASVRGRWTSETGPGVFFGNSGVRAVIVADSDHVILSAIQPETIAHRIDSKDGVESDQD